MEIYAICKTLDAGEDRDKKNIQKYGINVGDKFLLEDAIVKKWASLVFLSNFPDTSFNSVFFDFCDENGNFVNICQMKQFIVS